jgi:nitrogen fixation-related uncharacterized protein
MDIKPVRQKYALHYFQNVIVFFVITVLGLRVFLESLGYPQISPGVFHISHLIWGGIFLLIASLIALLYKNKFLLNTSSILTGVGWGFFVDEIGKFITADYNYFFKLAAPLIYLSFLILLFFFWHFKLKKKESDKDKIYRILDDMEELIETRFYPEDLENLRKELRELNEKSEDSHIRKLSKSLLNFIKEENIKSRGKEIPKTVKMLVNLREKFSNLLVCNFIVHYIFPLVLVVYGFVLILNSYYHIIPFFRPFLASLYHASLAVNPFQSMIDSVIFIVMNTFRMIVGLLLIETSVRLALKKNVNWNTIRKGLLVLLVVVDLILFYFDQFSVAWVVVFELLLFYWNEYYRKNLR